MTIQLSLSLHLIINLMNKKYLLIIVFFSLVLVALLFLIYKYDFRIQQKDIIIREINDEKRFYESIVKLITNNAFLQFESTDTKMEDLIVYSNDDVNNRRLSDFLEDNSFLILRYNETYCKSCVDHSLEALLDYKDEIGIDNILIMATSENIRKLKAFVNKFENSNIKIINIISKIDLPIEKYNVPYFFVISNNLQIQMLFVPIKELPENTFRYLQVVSDRFFFNDIH